MKIDQVNITSTIAAARAMIKDPTKIAPELAVIINVLLSVIELLLPRLFKNSKNSSIPPSQDPNREKTKKDGSKRKPGGQEGRSGVTLEAFAKPDETIVVPVDRSTLPLDQTFTGDGYIKRQVIEFYCRRHVIEYQLEVLKDKTGKRYSATAPPFVNASIQYGNSVKATAVYMSNYQLLPYARLENYFRDQAKIPISPGSLYNFNLEAYDLLETFDKISKNKLASGNILHTDETGININGKRQWLHTASNEKWVNLEPHAKRGRVAMEEIGILQNFTGVMIHDHWSAYFTYGGCLHAVCNAHHLRELQAVIELSPQHAWAKKTKELLLTIKDTAQLAGGVLSFEEQERFRKSYRDLMDLGLSENVIPESLPAPEEIGIDGKKKKKRKKRLKKSKERNLVERLARHESDVLRFMTDKDVPFTNNQGERDLRMTKVQQKISGCFKTIETAKIHCRIRSYLLTAQRHDLSPTEALQCLFDGVLPSFCDQ